MIRSKCYSKGDVPFSWEKRPGASMADEFGYRKEGTNFLLKLPPPPCPTSCSPAKKSFHDIQIPLPPCTFQTRRRSNSRKGSKNPDDDPFWAAYIECTKSKATSKSTYNKLFKSDAAVLGWKKGMASFSCKLSSNYVDDSIVKRSQLHCEGSVKERRRAM
ncbi:hypothetical protein K2173_028473 [Erythroxylum novogranatense]|uniref:Uncharacterized protein n=1 Tax=Erythroxylum novogranatense TaxID=1862640 RepID=A0AAV8U399_9ROSI|nr:hypothetical protein K2173_028473 [Erythroxylum novogranatense]